MYRILWDYRSEGRVYHTDADNKIAEYKTVNEAVHTAVEECRTTPFEIVSVARWRAEYYSQD